MRRLILPRAAVHRGPLILVNGEHPLADGAAPELAVVDERQRLQGVIVRGLLLGALVEHNRGGSHAA